MSKNQSENIDIDNFIQEGVALLKKNLELYASFDPTRPYAEKNEYFNELEERGRILFKSGRHWMAERYYERLCGTIHEYEWRHNKKFNKGMAYANLGIAQMASGKFDEGITHLLMAGEQDQPVAPGFDVLDTRLWKQFELTRIFPFLKNVDTSPYSRLNFRVDDLFLTNLVKDMEQQDRMFFEKTIWVLCDTKFHYPPSSNVHTRGRLYSSLKDLCLLAESLLRKKQIASGMIQSTDQITLGGRSRRPSLLRNALSNKGIGYPQTGLNVWANDIQEFLNNLEHILGNAPSDELRRVYCLHLVRNFTGHHFDLSETITSPNGKTFFDMYETVLINILSVIMYFKHVNEI